MYDHLLALRKAKSGYDVSAASGQTLQQTPKVLGSAEIMRNQVTEPIVAYSLLRYLISALKVYLKLNQNVVKIALNTLEKPILNIQKTWVKLSYI
jgi:hypothetical protein